MTHLLCALLEPGQPRVSESLGPTTFPSQLSSLWPPPFLGVVVSLPSSFVPGMIRVRVGGSSDTFTDVVHGERKQEVCLHLAGHESGLLRREGKARSGCVMESGPWVLPVQVPPGLLNVLLPVSITSHGLI